MAANDPKLRLNRISCARIGHSASLRSTIAPHSSGLPSSTKTASTATGARSAIRSSSENSSGRFASLLYSGTIIDKDSVMDNVSALTARPNVTRLRVRRVKPGVAKLRRGSAWLRQIHRPDCDYFKHELAVVESSSVGRGTRIWAFAHVLPGAQIGADCNICDHTFIENDVVIGDRVTIKCGVYVWDGIRLEDDVFVGPTPPSPTISCRAAAFTISPCLSQR